MKKIISIALLAIAGLAGAQQLVPSTKVLSLSTITNSQIVADDQGMIWDSSVGILKKMSIDEMDIRWAGGSLAGFVQKSGDTMTGGLGIIYSGVLPTTVPYLNANSRFTSSSVTPTELGYLSGVTAALQTQINAIVGGSGLPVSGGTMTGGLGLDYSGASASGVVVTDTDRVLKTSTTVSLTELGYLDGVTQAIQTQINALALGASFVAKVGDTMSGNLYFSGSNLGIVGATDLLLSSSGAGNTLYLRTNGSTRLSFDGGGVVNVGAPANWPFVQRAGDTLTGNLGFSGSSPSIGSTTSLRTTMLGVTTNPVGMIQRSSADGAHVNTSFGDAVAYDTTNDAYVMRHARDRAGQVISNVINGSTSASATAELLVSTNAGGVRLYNSSAASGATGRLETLTGVTGGLVVSTSGSAPLYLQSNGTSRLTFDGSGNVTVGSASSWPFAQRAGDTMSGSLGLNYANVTVDRAAYVDASRILRTSANVSSTELEYLDGVTANLQTQINAVVVGGGLPTTGGTMTGGIGLNYVNATPDRAMYLDGSRVARTSANVSSTELEYLDGTTAAVQTQLDARDRLFGGAGDDVRGWARLNCQSSSVISRQKGSWVSSIGNISSGACVVTVAGFANVGFNPNCVISSGTDNSGAPVVLRATTDSNTQVTIDCASGTSETACSNYSVTLLCFGT